MSLESEKIHVLPYAQREERVHDGRIEMIRHLPAHPRACVIRRTMGENNLLKHLQPFTYQQTEWLAEGQTIDTAYALVAATHLRTYQKHELLAVGSTLSFEYANERMYLDQLVALMQHPPFHADFIYEEAPECVYHRMHPLRKALRKLVGISERPFAVRHTFSFWRLKVRAVPPQNVISFDGARRKKKA